MYSVSDTAGFSRYASIAEFRTCNLELCTPCHRLVVCFSPIHRCQFHFSYDPGGRPWSNYSIRGRLKLRQSNWIQQLSSYPSCPSNLIPAIQRMLYQNFITTVVALAASVLVVPVVHAHPGEVEPVLTARQLERRQAAINARHAVVRNCDKEIRAFEVRRRARRSAFTTKKHGKSPPEHGNGSTKCSSAASGTETGTKTSAANTPTYTTLQNVSLILAVLSRSTHLSSGRRLVY